jgi:hypothetical protein
MTWIHVIGGMSVTALRPPFFTPSSDPLLQWLPCGNQGLAWRMSWIWDVAALQCVYLPRYR